MHVSRWFDFNALLPEAVVYVHHGGQNRVVSALMHGVPQIICAGKHYERRYNGTSVERIAAGFSLEARQFTPTTLRNLVRQFTKDPSYTLVLTRSGGRFD
jgi:UDP:flavonoid glycosyltransferase YjiC (YdhE family)